MDTSYHQIVAFMCDMQHQKIDFSSSPNINIIQLKYNTIIPMMKKLVSSFWNKVRNASIKCLSQNAPHLKKADFGRVHNVIFSKPWLHYHGYRYCWWWWFDDEVLLDEVRILVLVVPLCHEHHRGYAFGLGVGLRRIRSLHGQSNSFVFLVPIQVVVVFRMQ